MTSTVFDPANDELIIARARKEIVFIEDNLADYQTIAANAGAGRQVVILDSTRDGLQQIADAMKGLSGIDAVHVVTHGAEGRIGLGTLTLDQTAVEQHKDVLAAIGSSMSADGDIMFYGCSVGAGQGADLIGQLAIATGADVAASNDLTGDAALGGDWNLEVAAGSIETPALVDAALAAQYHQLLGAGKAITFDPGNTPYSFGFYGVEMPQNDLSYLVSGSTSLKFDGETEGVGSYKAGYITFGANSIETKITVSLSDGQVFTPTSVDLNRLASSDQTLVFTGLNASGTLVISREVNVDSDAFAAKALSGFTDIKTLVITAKTGLIKYVQMDNLVLSSIGDSTPPTLAITSNKSTVMGGDTAAITFTFSEDPGASFTAADIVVSNGTLSALSGSGFTRMATFTPAAGINGSAAIISVASNKYADAANNFNTSSSTLSLTVDTVVPTVTITSDISTIKDGGHAAITFTFSEDPGASFTGADVVVSNGSIGPITGSGATRYATLTPSPGLNGAPVSITVTDKSYADAAGNLGTAGVSPPITADNVVPGAPTTPVLDPTTDKGASSSDNVTSWTVLTFTGSAESGVATVKLFDTDGVTQIGSGSITSGPYNINTSPLTNGVHTITARAYDAAGNESIASGSVSVTVDTAPPTLSITSTPSTLKAGEASTIRFTFSEDPGTSFSWDGSAGDIVVSGGTLSALTGSGATREAIFTPSANTDAGSASIRVLSGTYEDLAGNGGVASNNLTISYDTLAPSAPGTPALAAGDDTGTSNSDGITNDNTLSFSGTATNGTTVKLYDGATQIGSVTASGSTYTIPVAGLAEGSHTLTATAFDAAGNVSTASGALVLTVDQTPPATTVAGAALSQDSGVSNSDMITKIAGQTISGTLSANLAAGERVMVSLDNGASWNPATASAGTNTWELANVTLAGSNTLKVKVEDLAGNGGAVYSHAYTLDQVAPSAPSTPDLDAASDSGSSSTDNLTNVTLPSFSGTGEIGSTVTLFDGGIEIGSTTVGLDGKWQVTTSAGTPLTERPGDMPHYITSVATDLAGNVAASNIALEVVVRTSAPSTTIASVTLSADTGGSSTDFITKTASQTIAGTLSANLASGERVQVSLNGGTSWTDATSAVGSNTWLTTTTLANGAHDIRVRVIDALDNTGPVLVQGYTLDQVQPTVAITSNVSTLKAGDTATITFTFSEDPGSTFSWDGSAGDLTVSGGTLSAISGSGLTRTATFTPAANTNAGTASIGIPAGSYQDLAGNNGLAGTSPSITFDTLAPAASSTPDLDAASDKGGSSTDNLTNLTSLTFKGTAEAGATVKLYDSDGSTEIGSGTATGGNWTIATSTLGAGSHSVTAKVFDAAGNVSAVSGATAVTIDTTAPTLVISSDVSQLKTGETATITFTFSEDPGATFTWDGTAGDVTVSGGTLSAISGTGTVRTASFTPSANTNGGAASISVSAGSYRDAAGNDGGAGATPSLNFDTLAPAAPSTPDLDTASDTGSSATDNFTADTTPTFSGTAESGATVTLYDGATAIGSIVAAGGAWQITSDRALSAGAHTITAKAVDAAGNAGAASSGLALQIITSGPATGVKEMALSLDSGTAGDFITNTAAQTISGLLDAVLAAGERVQVSLDGGTAWNDVVSSAGSDAWSIAAILSAGAHDIRVRVIDAIDNTGPVHIQAYTLDSVKPAVAITSDVSQLKSGDTANITFTFTEDPGTSFDSADISVSGGTLSALSGTGATRTAVFTPSAGTNAGTASISIDAGTYEDIAGNAGLAGASPSISFDTLAPAAASAPDLDAASDKGGSSTDNLTNLTSLTFKGTAEAGATVKLYDSDGSTEIGSGTATGGNWTIATSTLGAGSHSVTAKVFDAAGNVSAVSGATAVTIDTVKPILAITSDASQLKAGGTATITFTFSEDPGTSFDSSDIALSGGTLSALSGTGATRTAVFTPTADTNSGTANISVIAGAYQDAAGNDGTAGAMPSLHFDTLAPAAPSAPVLVVDNGSSDSDNIVTDAALSFKGTAEDLSTITLYDADSGAVLANTIAFAGKWMTPMLAPMSEGPHRLYVTATDAAGNVSAPSAITTVTVDTIAPPDVTLSSDVSKVKIGETATITFTFSADPGADFSLANLSANGAGTFGPLSGTGLTRTAVFTPYPDHDSESVFIHIVNYRDVAGNLGTSGSFSLLVDTRAPAAPSTPVLSAGSDTGSSSSDGITSDTTPLFSGTKETASTVTLYDSDGTVLGSEYELIGAWSIESAALSEGTHTITAKQTDSLGNVSVLSSGVTIVVDTHADALAAPVLAVSSDSATKGDSLTSDTTPTVTGSAEANASVTLYDSDGTTVLGTATADAGGAWSITSSVLSPGSHALTVRQVDLAGNASSASPALTLNIDNEALALAAPVLAAASDSGALGDAITKTTTPTFSGSAEALAQVTLYDGATVIGSVQADAQGAWQITAATLPDGVHAISARQVDLAGNASGAGAVFSLTVDTVAPAAPAAPSLKASSDTGSIGDGLTENTMPVIEGTALADTLVTLYETVGGSKVKLGTAMADGSGKWSVATTGLSIGAHLLSATQSDAAGNESAASAGFTLRIEEAPMPIDLVDGMPVQVFPISLPGNVPGTAVSIPVVGAGRAETSGQAGVADIPLVKSGQGAPILLAQLPAGYGLSASGANLPAANAGELLIAAIKAATPSHAPSDQGHLTGNGQSFLAGLASSGSLLVETVKPVSSAAPDGVLTLSGPAPGAGQSTALVIDAGGLAAGATIALQQVNFAAVIGAANVTAGSGTILSGDGASQHFTVAAGGTGSVFAGGGSDVLSIAAPAAAGPAPAAGVALLHGGAANDAATFSGARADYNIEFHNGYVMVSTKAAPDVKAMVVNVEQLQFSDASIAVQNNADMGTLAGIYQTVLGRQADVMGIEYWANVHQAGASWGAIALSMIASSEHAASHEGFNGVAAHDLALLYASIFNREADAGGMAYWTAALGRGLTLEQVASSFVESAEMVGHQRAAADWDFIVG